MLLTFYKPFMGKLAVSFSMLVTGQVLFLALPYLQGRIIDNLAKHAPISYSMYLIGAMLTAYLLSNLLNYLRDRYEIKNLDYNLPEFVGTTTLRKMLGFSLGQHINENSGLRLSVITKGNEALSQFMQIVVFSFLPFLIQIVGFSIIN